MITVVKVKMIQHNERKYVFQGTYVITAILFSMSGFINRTKINTSLFTQESSVNLLQQEQCEPPA